MLRRCINIATSAQQIEVLNPEHVPNAPVFQRPIPKYAFGITEPLSGEEEGKLVTPEYYGLLHDFIAYL
jgi:hypothetical protein